MNKKILFQEKTFIQYFAPGSATFSDNKKGLLPLGASLLNEKVDICHFIISPFSLSPPVPSAAIKEWNTAIKNEMYNFYSAQPFYSSFHTEG